MVGYRRMENSANTEQWQGISECTYKYRYRGYTRKEHNSDLGKIDRLQGRRTLAASRGFAECSTAEVAADIQLLRPPGIMRGQEE